MSSFTAFSSERKWDSVQHVSKGVGAGEADTILVSRQEEKDSRYYNGCNEIPCIHSFVKDPYRLNHTIGLLNNTLSLMEEYFKWQRSFHQQSWLKGLERCSLRRRLFPSITAIWPRNTFLDSLQEIKTFQLYRAFYLRKSLRSSKL